jgi:hypothetical protein
VAHERAILWDSGSLLGGGSVTEHNWDIGRSRLALRVEVLDAGGSVSHLIEMHGVRQIDYAVTVDSRVEYDYTEPWDYTELTSIEARRTEYAGQQFLQVDLNFWDIGTAAVMCKDIRVDGASLV